MTVYKFINSAFVPALLNYGELRIATASWCRKPDGVGDGRSDTVEMVRAQRFDQPAEYVAIAKSGTPVRVSFAPGTRIRHHAEAYLYCVSTTIDPELRRRMRESFECDAVFRIADVAAFASALNRADSRLQGGGFAGQVRYSDDWQATSYERDALRKRTRYSWQKEFRLVWPLEAPADPFTVRVPDIVSMIEMIE